MTFGAPEGVRTPASSPCWLRPASPRAASLLCRSLKINTYSKSKYASVIGQAGGWDWFQASRGCGGGVVCVCVWDSWQLARCWSRAGNGASGDARWVFAHRLMHNLLHLPYDPLRRRRCCKPCLRWARSMG